MHIHISPLFWASFSPPRGVGCTSFVLFNNSHVEGHPGCFQCRVTGEAALSIRGGSWRLTQASLPAALPPPQLLLHLLPRLSVSSLTSHSLLSSTQPLLSWQVSEPGLACSRARSRSQRGDAEVCSTERRAICNMAERGDRTSLRPAAPKARG